jgi:hypothetical protein
MSLVLPGSGHLFLGKSVRGIAFSIVFLLSILAFAYRHGVERSEWLTPVQSSLLLTFLIGFIYIAFVGLVVWNINREK